MWTNVDDDPVAMRRGDLLLTPGMRWHEHHNTTDQPMAWIDGLDIPLVRQLDAGFFELGSDTLSTRDTPSHSRNERLWGHAGLVPVGAPRPKASPLMAYRWEPTDAALAAQLELGGFPGVVEPGHAVVRYTNPATGGDALTTIRTEMHRLDAGCRTGTARVAGSSVWQIFDGEGEVELDGERHVLETGDLFVVPSWAALSLATETGLDAFRFSDDPVFERLGLDRSNRME